MLEDPKRAPRPATIGGVMVQPPTDQGAQLIMALGQLDQLLDAITRRGFRLIGPTVRDGAIVYDEITSSADLPAGWTDEQDGGTYRLRRRGDEALFGYNVGPQSWKRHLFPPSSLLARVRSEDGVSVAAKEEADPLAFIGVRSCELHHYSPYRRGPGRTLRVLKHPPSPPGRKESTGPATGTGSGRSMVYNRSVPPGSTVPP